MPCHGCGKTLKHGKENYESIFAQAGSKRRKARKGRRMARLELIIMAGAESKAFLGDLEKLVARMEKAGGVTAATADDADETDDDEDEDFGKKTTSKKATALDADDDEDEDEADDEDEDAAPAKKTKGKKAAALDDDADDADDEDEDESDDEDEEEETAKKTKGKATKAKKLTIDDINDACKARVQKVIKSGQPGPEARKSVFKLLKKKFGVTSVTELKADQYADVIKALSA